MTPETLQRAFGTIPLAAERAFNLVELGQGLLDAFDGEATHFIEAAGQSAVRLVELVARSFKSFDDRTTYRGQPARFYKRAQILAIDLHSALAGSQLGRFDDLEALTAFADYKVPQVLREAGVLVYREDLAEAVAARTELPAGSEAEVEIRAATVHAVHLLAQATGIGEADLDGILWHLGQDISFSAPYHRTRTIYY